MAGSRTLKLSILADVDNLKKNLDTGSKEVSPSVTKRYRCYRCSNCVRRRTNP